MDAIHNGEIWHASQCLKQETIAANMICIRLADQGYQRTTAVSNTRSIWTRKDQQVVVSLVDDAWDCALDRSQDTPYLFDINTMVITDNWINTPTVYQVARLPDSFYGIYSYVPKDQAWEPDRDYTFGVNRLDFKRMQVFLNIHQQLSINNGYVNFNCETRQQTVQASQQSFLDQLVHAEPAELPAFRQLADMIPVKNYTIDHDQIYTRSWLNIMVETYSSDNVISLSEKIFRCLVTPVPWTAYSGRYTVARLRSLGFDVLDDVVDHSYDRLIEAHHKMSGFVGAANSTITALKTQNWPTLKQRCKTAAEHNQQLLAAMKVAWPGNFESWLQEL